MKIQKYKDIEPWKKTTINTLNISVESVIENDCKTTYVITVDNKKDFDNLLYTASLLNNLKNSRVKIEVIGDIFENTNDMLEYITDLKSINVFELSAYFLDTTLNSLCDKFDYLYIPDVRDVNTSDTAIILYDNLFRLYKDNYTNLNFVTSVYSELDVTIEEFRSNRKFRYVALVKPDCIELYYTKSMKLVSYIKDTTSIRVMSKTPISSAMHTCIRSRIYWSPILNFDKYLYLLGKDYYILHTDTLSQYINFLGNNSINFKVDITKIEKLHLLNTQLLLLSAMNKNCSIEVSIHNKGGYFYDCAPILKDMIKSWRKANLVDKIYLHNPDNANYFYTLEQEGILELDIDIEGFDYYKLERDTTIVCEDYDVYQLVLCVLKKNRNRSIENKFNIINKENTSIDNIPTTNYLEVSRNIKEDKLIYNYITTVLP